MKEQKQTQHPSTIFLKPQGKICVFVLILAHHNRHVPHSQSSKRFKQSALEYANGNAAQHRSDDCGENDMTPSLFWSTTRQPLEPYMRRNGTPKHNTEQTSLTVTVTTTKAWQTEAKLSKTPLVIGSLKGSQRNKKLARGLTFLDYQIPSSMCPHQLAPPRQVETLDTPALTFKRSLYTFVSFWSFFSKK